MTKFAPLFASLPHRVAARLTSHGNRGGARTEEETVHCDASAPFAGASTSATVDHVRSQCKIIDIVQHAAAAAVALAAFDIHDARCARRVARSINAAVRHRGLGDSIRRLHRSDVGGDPARELGEVLDGRVLRPLDPHGERRVEQRHVGERWQRARVGLR